MIDVLYEELVVAPEAVMKMITHALDLPWQRKVIIVVIITYHNHTSDIEVVIIHHPRNTTTTHPLTHALDLPLSVDPLHLPFNLVSQSTSLSMTQ